MENRIKARKKKGVSGFTDFTSAAIDRRYSLTPCLLLLGLYIDCVAAPFYFIFRFHFQDMHGQVRKKRVRPRRIVGRDGRGETWLLSCLAADSLVWI